MVCFDSKSDGDLDAVTEVGCVGFVVTARVTVILMHSDLDAVTEVVCVVCCDSKSESDRYFMALYRKLLDPALRSSAKQPQFLNLLYKSMKDDIMDKRVKVG